MNKNASEILDWWAGLCLFNCELNPSKACFGDQTYLNLIPVKYEGVKIIRHKGCNVANWNQLECKRTQQPDGSVLINNEFPIVFIHFTPSTIKGILQGGDGLLMGYLSMYNTALNRFNPDCDMVAAYRSQMEEEKTASTLQSRTSLIASVVRKVKSVFGGRQ